MSRCSGLNCLWIPSNRAKGDAPHHVDAKHAFSVFESRLPPDRLCLVDRYALKNVAFKVVGVGSVGTFCAIGLYMCGDGTPLFLQIKEAGKSVLERLAPKFKGHQGQRVVEGQRVMQTASDVFIGWTEDVASHRHFYARVCGRTLARAHARSADPAVLAGYMGKRDVLDDALASFAMAYAVCTQDDYEQLVTAKRDVKRRRSK